MSVPSPSKSLDGHCSTIWNEQLFVLSSNTFQSVALKQGSKWSEEAIGQAVTGAACAKVQQGDASTAQLYVVGGTSSNASYTGLQRYSFSSKTWETLQVPTTDLRDRLNHTAIYIPAADQILVYAGNKASEPGWLSSSTFTVQATAPHIINSYSTDGRTANEPILGTWDNSRVFMTGGSDIAATSYLFEANVGWSRYQTSMSAPLVPGIRGAVVSGSDGSKVLQTYDATVSPNKISAVLLQNADGSAAAIGQVLGSSAKRALTATNWPAYNNTNAPSTVRSDYSIATDADQGLVVLAGGSTASSVSIFNQTANSWVNAASFFSGNSQTPLVVSSSAASSSVSATSTASSSATSAMTATSSSTDNAATATAGTVAASIVDDANARQSQQLKTQLGIVLGVCGAIFLFFILLMLWLRARKRREEKGTSYVGNNEGGRMSFADRGASFMKEAEGSQANFYPTADRYSVATQSPYDTAQGRRGVSGAAYKGYGNHKQKGSYESTKELVEKDHGYMAEPVEMTPVTGKKMSPVIRKPAPAYYVERTPEISSASGALITPAGQDKDERKRSSGWSRYFATSQPAENGLSHIPTAYQKDGMTDATPAKGSAYASTDSQAPSLPALPSQLPSASLMPALNIDFSTTLDGQRLSKVASSNPSYFNSHDDLSKQATAAQLATIERSPSTRTTASSFDDRATTSSNAPSEYYSNTRPQEAWTPMTMATSFKEHANTSDSNSRRASSTYTASVYGERPRSRGTHGHGSGFFPGAGTLTHKKNTSKSKVTYSAAPSADWGSLNEENMATLKQALNNRDTTHSNVTVFPEPMPNGDGYTATTRQPSNKALKTQESIEGSGMAGLGQDKSTRMTLFPRAVSIKQVPGAATSIDVSGGGERAANTDVSWVKLDSR